MSEIKTTQATAETVSLTLQEAIQAVQAGRMVLITDDESRENEADLCVAAQFATAEVVNFMAHKACGMLCVALSGELLDRLSIPLLDSKDSPLQGTAFTMTVDARRGTTTGISAHDRSLTIRTLVDPTTVREDLARPGHIAPLRAHPNGTLERRGHTEAAVDLMRLAGLTPGAAICEVLDEQGQPAHGKTLHSMAQSWGIGIISVDEIARYRRHHSISLVAHTQLPIEETRFELLDYQEIHTGQQYLALMLGDLTDEQLGPPLLRLHSACATGDIFGSQRCDCQAQMHAALRAIAQEERGILLYLPQEGRNIGLVGKLQAYALQDQGLDTIEANEKLGYPVDARDYTTAIEILHELRLHHVRLLTNSPRKLQALTNGGIKVERVPLEITPNMNNELYLKTKHQRMGHLLSSLATNA
ncbi:riboflavin biosynthesis protein RibBA [Ktedonobacteria bacterium brp13]|nr:riboflavin biosynthesis protein RibBA [Ktedonobacteria bacterium brp13]